MRWIKVVAFLALLFYSVVAQQPQPDYRFEAGVMVGEPTGLSLKYWITRYSAVDLAAGWSFSDANVDLSLDYQYHYFWPNFPRGELPLFFGLGVALQIEDESYFGARIPLGVQYIFEEPRFTAFLEIAPELRLIPDTELAAAGGIGLRFRF